MTTNPLPANLLLTGAAGTLGRELAEPLRARWPGLVLSDLAGSLAALASDARKVPCDLADAAAVDSLLGDIDAVVHLGGVSVEAPFEQILRIGYVPRDTSDAWADKVGHILRRLTTETPP